MTAISTPLVRAAATPFERILLGAASGLDGFVAHRLELRGGTEYRRAHRAQTAHAAAREAAQARSAIGLLPR